MKKHNMHVLHEGLEKFMGVEKGEHNYEFEMEDHSKLMISAKDLPEAWEKARKKYPAENFKNFGLYE